ncbi:concanavalin A-like lectin/glucanase [Meredithblackwellia eburnea MCA 4105]
MVGGLHLLPFGLVALSLSTKVVLGASSITCGPTQKCPQSTPCCSTGVCGTGTSCIQLCSPLWSYSIGACAPVPICQDANYTFASLDRVRDASVYNNDASVVDWVSDGRVFTTADGNLALTLSKTDGGASMSTARAMWYGDASARFRTGNWTGVITAFITMSGVRDEVDWEFAGTSSNLAQSNYYFEGNTANFTHGGNTTITSAYANSHEFGFHWTPDVLQWTIDGSVVRTVLRNDTWNAQTSTYEFPQSPSFVQLGIWASGTKGQSASTIEWGGGLTDWTNPAYTANGYYSVEFEYVNIKCYNGTTNGTSYIYGTNVTGVPQITISEEPTLIYSTSSTGYNQSAGASAQQIAKATNGTLVGVTPSSSNGALKMFGFSGVEGYLLAIILFAFAILA